MTRSYWRHLAALLLFAAVLSAVQYVPHLRRMAPGADAGTFAWLFVIGLSRELLRIFPMLPGVAIATAGTGRPGARGAARLLALVLAIVVAGDLVARPALARAWNSAALRAAPTWPLARDTFDLTRPIERDGAIRTAIAYAIDTPAAVHETRRSYELGHPRWVAMDLVMELGLILLPFITMGVVLGAASWVRQRVTFRSARDEVVARWVLAWLLTGAVTALYVNWPLDLRYELSIGASFWQPVLVSIPFLALAALGWRAAAREPAPPPSAA